MIIYTWGDIINMNEDRPASVMTHAEIESGLAYADEQMVIELRDGAYTDEEVEAINAEEAALYLSDYDVKWRAWFGDPSEEEKANEPWGDMPEE